MSESIKFYPKPYPIVAFLTVSLGLLWSGLWLMEHAAALAESWGMPTVERVLEPAARLLAGVGFLASMVVSMPLAQLVIWRRPSVSIEQDALVLVLGLVRAQRFSWRDVAGAKARKPRRLLGLGWVTIALQPTGRSRGRNTSVPSFFLDRDVAEVAAAIEARIQSRAGEHPPRTGGQPQPVQQRRRRRRRQPGARR